MENLEPILSAALPVVEKAGEFQMKHFRAVPEEAADIKSLRETVSFVDVESENILRDGLLPLVDGAGFYGEESGKTGSQESAWVVDPLDGTTNYLSGIDHFSVSVALVSNNRPVLGIIHQPATGNTFTSVRDGGVFYNGELVKPRCLDHAVEDALFVTGFPYRSPDVAEGFFSAASRILTLGRGIRRSGSAALDVANLAAGWYQGFWETDLQPYDVAAGVLMMEENGIVCTNQRGEPYDLFRDRLLVAALPQVHPPLLAAVVAGYGEL
ncbi:MAG: inositol monophosphatase family protein [Akkermansiaceae bacterium]